MIPCSALLFDLDGLMVDSEPLWFDVERAFAASRGGEWTLEHGHRCIGQGMAHTLNVMHQEFGFPVQVEDDSRAIVDMFVARVGELALKPGCLELVQRARRHGLRCAVASSSARRLVEAVLDRFDLRGHFDAVVTGDCVVRHKPAPDVFLMAASRLSIAPSACVVLEDSFAGVQAARAAGMRVIAVPERTPERLVPFADAVVVDLNEASATLSFSSVTAGP